MKRVLMAVAAAQLLVTALPAAESPSALAEKARAHVMLAWEESLNIYHFEKAGELYRGASRRAKGLSRAEVDPAKKEALAAAAARYLAESRVQDSRAKRFSILVRNRYPVLPVAAGGYDFQSVHLPADLVGAKQSLDELMDNIKLLAVNRGQMQFILLGEDGIMPEALDYAFNFLNNRAPFGAVSPDELFDSYGRTLQSDEVRNSPRILESFAASKGYSSLIVLVFGKKPLVNGAFAYPAGMYRWDAADPGKLALVADVCNPGQNTLDFRRQSSVRWGLHAAAVIALLAFVFFVADRRGAFYPGHQGALTRLKAMITGCVLLLLGAAAGYGAARGMRVFFSDWQEPAGTSPGMVWAMSVVAIALALALIVLALFRAVRHEMLTGHALYLPVFFAAFLSGIGLWFVKDLYYFDLLYPGTANGPFIPAMLPAFALTGALAGDAVRALLAGWGKTAEGERRALAVSLAALSLALVAVTALIEFVLSDRISFIPAIAVCIAAAWPLYRYSRSGVMDFSASTSARDEDETAIVPEDTDSLLKTLERPLYVEPGEVDSALDYGRAHLSESIAREGGILLVTGPQGAGKTRYIEELLKHDDFRKARVIHLACDPSAEEQGTVPYAPFVKALGDLPDVKRLSRSFDMGERMELAAGTVSEAAGDIPFLGTLLKLAFTRGSGGIDESGMEEQLAAAINNLSRYLIEKGGDSQIIFLVDDFTSMDRQSKKLISAIRAFLRDDVKSAEKNPLAFIIEYRSGDETGQSDDISPRGIMDDRDEERVVTIRGLEADRARELFFGHLNFSPMAEELFQKLFAQSKIDDTHASVRYMLESITALLVSEDAIEAHEGRFRLKSGMGPDLVKIPSDVKQGYREQLKSIREDGLFALESASVVGMEFDADAVAAVSGLDRVSVLRALLDVEKKIAFVREVREGGAFRFKNPIARNVMTGRLFYDSGGKKLPRRLFVEYNRRLADYYTAVLDSGALSGRDAADCVFNIANSAYGAGEGYEKLSRTYNLEAALKIWKESPNSTEASRYLARVLDIDRNVDFLRGQDSFSGFGELLAWIMQDRRGEVMVTHGEYARYFSFLKDECLDRWELDAGEWLHLAEISFIIAESGMLPSWSYDDTIAFTRRALAARGGDEYLAHRASFWAVSVDKKRKHDPKGALARMDETRIFLETHPDLEGRDPLLSRVYNTMGELCMAQKPADGECALSWFEKSYEIKKGFGDFLGMAMSAGAVTEILTDSGRYDEALRWSERSLVANRKILSNFGIDRSLAAMGRLYELSGEYGKARGCYARCFAHHAIDSRFYRALALYNLSMVTDTPVERHIQAYFNERLQEKNIEEVRALMDTWYFKSQLRGLHPLTKDYISVMKKQLSRAARKSGVSLEPSDIAGLSLDPGAALHVLRHFTDVDEAFRLALFNEGIAPEDIEEELSLPGSRFFPEFAADPFDLLEKIKSRARDTGAKFPWKDDLALCAFTFDASDYPGGIGTDSVIRVDFLPDEARETLHKKPRGDNNDYLLNFVRLKEYPLTWQANCIVKRQGDSLAVLTIFPGTLSDPIPDRDAHTAEQYRQYDRYWKDYAFIEVE